MRSRVVRATLAIAGTSVLALAGCGGDDGGGSSGGGGKDDEQITAVFTKGLTTSDPEVKCVETVTPAFVKNIYGTVEQCRKAEAPEADDNPNPTGADVADIAVKGDTATALVTVKGGTTDKASGIIRFAKDGDAWKVDDLDITFLRSQLAQGFANRTYTSKDGPLADPTYRACVLKGLGALDDTTFKAVAFNAIAETAPDPRFVEVFSTCEKTIKGADSGDLPEAPTKVRASFETGLGKDAKKGGATDAQITCVFKTLRSTLDDDTILAEIKKGTYADPKGVVKTKVNAAIKSCPSSSSSSSGSSGGVPGLSKAPTKLREQFEAGLIKTAKKSSASDKKIACILTALRSSITDAEIAKQIGRGNDELAKPSNPLTSAIRKAGTGC